MRIANIILTVLFFTQIALGTSISPEILNQLRESGQLEQIILADKMAREKGVWQANPDPYRPGMAADVDTLHCLIILVDFEDMPHELGFNASPADFDTLLFSVGVTYPGSMTDYYFETSYGQALLLGQVTQWYRMPQLYSYYVDGQRGFGQYPRNAQKLTEDAVMAADPDVDFSIYDNDGNGYVDGLFIVHAGPGYEDTGNVNYIHSHAWVTSYPIPLDQVYVYRYSMEPEETAANQLITIGVFCHEFGHVLGLPDLYDYDYDSRGVGMWSIMAGGSWGGGGARPVHFDAWSKIQLGWVSPTVVDENIIQEQIDAVEFSPDIYQIYSLGIPLYQYFLVENRRRRLFDLSLPGEGLLIFHIDETVPNNNNQNHYKVAVEQADGNLDLEFDRNGGDAGDPWPGSTENRTFDDFSVPNANLYFNEPSQIAVANISDSDSMMFADLFILYNYPLYELLEITFDDSQGNNNGRPEEGETCDLIFTAQNIRIEVDQLLVIASCSDPAIAFSDSASAFGSLPVNQPFTNEADPMTFTVPDNYPAGYVEFTLNFIALGGQYQQEIAYSTVVGTPDLFFVDDDDGAALDTFITLALENIEIPFHSWNISDQGSPAQHLIDYGIVIWFTGNTRPGPMQAIDVSGLISFLTSGGSLLMTSQDFVQRLTERGDVDDLTLLHDLLKVDYDGYESAPIVFGEAGSVFEGLQFLTAGVGGADNQESRDALLVRPGGQQMFGYGGGTVAAVGVADGYAALTVGFGIEAIANDNPLSNTREEFIEAAIEFLTQTTGITDIRTLPEKTGLSQNYPNPFNAATVITYNLPAAGDISLKIYNLLGQKVATLFEGFQQSGEYSIIWNATAFPSGIYFARLESEKEKSAIKIVLLK